MGYSNSEETLATIRPKLREIEAGNPCVWRSPSYEAAHQFAYKIREAFHIARLFPEKYPKLARASRLFKIQKETRDGGYYVRAVSNTMNEMFDMTALMSGTDLGQYAEPSSVAVIDTEPETQPSAPFEVADEHHGAQSQFSVIQTWIGYKPPPRALRFPEAALTTPQLTQLHRWGQVQQPKVHLLVEPSGEGLTLTADPEVEEFAWAPEG